MACITCKGIDQYLYVADCLLTSIDKDLSNMQRTVKENNIGHGMLVSVVLIRNEIEDVRKYIGNAMDRAFSSESPFFPSHQETPSESEIEELCSDDEDMDDTAFDIEELPESPVFRPASSFISLSDVTPLTSPPASPGASSTLPRSDACSDLSSLSGPLKKIKQVNEELAKKNPGTFIEKKQDVSSIPAPLQMCIPQGSITKKNNKKDK